MQKWILFLPLSLLLCWLAGWLAGVVQEQQLCVHLESSNIESGRYSHWTEEQRELFDALEPSEKGREQMEQRALFEGASGAFEEDKFNEQPRVRARNTQRAAKLCAWPVAPSCARSAAPKAFTERTNSRNSATLGRLPPPEASPH